MNFKDQLIKMGFSEDNLRLLLDWQTIKNIPIKYCKNRGPIYKAMKGWFYNPIYHYPKYSRRIKGECGYDDQYRYVLI